MSSEFDNEQYKLIIDFSDVGLANYEVTTGGAQRELPPFSPDNPDAPWTHGTEGVQKYINKISTRMTAGASDSDPLGHLTSSQCFLYVFDEDDTINPMNSGSVYFGYMAQGRKAKVLRTDDGGTTWTQYFVGFITNWQGSYKDGCCGPVSLAIADPISSIGRFATTELDYHGSTALDALQAIFTAYGLTANDYVIDPDLQLNTLQCTALMSPARNTINDICYRSLACVQMKHDGKIYISKLYSPMETTPDWVVTCEDLGPITPLISNAVRYSVVKVNYTAAGGLAYKLLASQSDITLSDGVNKITLDAFDKIYSVESVDITVDEGFSPQEYNSVTYSAGENNINVTIDAELDNEKTARIDVYGLTAGGTQQKTELMPINGEVLYTDTTSAFEYNATDIMDDVEAHNLAAELAAYISTLRKRVEISQTNLSSDIEVGDVISISGIVSYYDNQYRVQEVVMEYGETYNVKLVLVSAS